MNRKQAARRREQMKKRITSEERARWAEMLRDTWQAIGYDIERAMADARQKLTRAIVIEATLDANRPEMYGGMTHEEYEALCIMSHTPSARRWLRETLNY